MNRFISTTGLLSLLLSVVSASALAEDIVIGGERPTALFVPSIYDSEVPMPLLLHLHGYGWDGAMMENATRHRPLAEEIGFLYATPDGLGTTGVDRNWTSDLARNSAYLRSLIVEVKERLNVDERRIVVIGYSNGGQMCYRVACDHGDLVTAVAVGGTAGYCRPPLAFPLLGFAGTLDGAFAAARSDVERWAASISCLPQIEQLQERLDLVANTPGLDTSIERWAQGSVTLAEFWTIQGAPHVLDMTIDGSTTRIAREVTEWLLGHPRLPPPDIVLTVTPSSGTYPLEVTADGSNTTIPDGTAMAEYCWKFGEKSHIGNVTESHTFSVPGRHAVALQVGTAERSLSAIATAHVDALCPSGDVSPWTASDVGEVEIPGAAQFANAAGSELLLCAAGAGTQSRADEFFFVHQEVEGDFRLSARISAFGVTSSRSAVGVMVRGSLEVDSSFAAVFLEARTSGLTPSGSFRFRHRPKTRELARSVAGDRPPTTEGWVRIERRGELLRGETSADGEAWTVVDEEFVSDLPRTVLAGISSTLLSHSPETFELLQARVSVEIEELPSVTFRRGDGNDDGRVDISDPVFVLNYLFGGGPAPSCLQTTDANDDNVVDIADPIYQLNHLFGGGPALPAPVGECGTDPTPAASAEDNLPCEAYPPCEA